MALTLQFYVTFHSSSLPPLLLILFSFFLQHLQIVLYPLMQRPILLSLVTI